MTQQRFVNNFCVIQCCGAGAGDGTGAGGNYFEELKLEPEP